MGHLQFSPWPGSELYFGRLLRRLLTLEIIFWLLKVEYFSQDTGGKPTGR
jgi:hypothetical protein